jgi:acyl-CoA thioester hydrolase
MQTNHFMHPIRVYFEDTDAAGIVYYANYLKFMERARTEWLRALDMPHHLLMASDAGVFVVKDVTLQLHAPARLDDALQVSCRVTQIAGARLQLAQAVMRDGAVLAASDISIVWVSSATLKPKRLPAALLKVLPAPHAVQNRL